jgi:hypothetical protein
MTPPSDDCIMSMMGDPGNASTEHQPPPPASGSPKLVLVPMPCEEAVEMLNELVSDLPHPLPYNVKYKQWDLMLPNIEELERRLWKVKRILAAVSENT